MKLIPSNGIAIGQRDEQQDDFGFSDPYNAAFVEHAGVLAVVVDGMGGVKYGTECARAAKATFLHEYEAKQPTESINQALDRALYGANEAVLAIARRYGDPKSVGATLTAAVVWRQRLTWVSIGDSALFILRDGRLQKLTAAHELVAEDGQTYVSSFLGAPQLLQVDRPLGDVPLQVGDRLVVCSDGLFKSVPEDMIGRVLGAAPAGDAGTQLVDAALAMRVPGQDNVTAIVLACEPDAAPSPITSNVPARSNAWLIAAIVVFAVILMSGAGAFAWYRYRDNRETQRIVKLSADIAAAFTTGNCAKVAELNHDLPETRPDAKDALEKAAKCGRFENFVHEGDVAYDAAGTAASPAEKRGHLQRAATNYQLALDQGIPGEQEAARIRGRITEARDQLARERTEPPPPAREGGAGPQRKPPEPVAADDDDEGHQRVKKPPPPKRPGREQDR